MSSIQNCVLERLNYDSLGNLIPFETPIKTQIGEYGTIIIRLKPSNPSEIKVYPNTNNGLCNREIQEYTYVEGNPLVGQFTYNANASALVFNKSESGNHITAFVPSIGETFIADVNVATEYDNTNQVMKTLKDTLNDITDNVNYINVSTNQLISEKVDKVDGKGLSVNDYSDDEKNKVSQIANKTDKSYVDNLVANSSRAVRGVFATVTALQNSSTANTTEGKTYTYVVSADNNWYYWNGSAWTKGGLYNALAIGQKSINSNMIGDGEVKRENIADLSILPQHTNWLLTYHARTTGFLYGSYDTETKYFKVKVPTSGINVTFHDTTGANKKALGLPADGEYLIPNLGIMLYNLTTGTVSCMTYSETISTYNNIVLLSNNNGQLTGVLSTYVRNSFDGMQIKSGTVTPDKATYKLNYFTKIDGVFDSTFDSVTKNITIKSRTPIVVNLYNKQMKRMSAPSLGANKEFVLPPFSSLCFYNGVFTVVEQNTVFEDYEVITLLHNNGYGILTGDMASNCNGSLRGNLIRENDIDETKIKNESVTLEKLNGEVIRYINGSGGGSSSTGSTNGVPAYWETHLLTKTREIKTLELKDINSFSFAFITDTHYEYSEKNYGKVLNYLNNSLGLSKILLGGDYIDGASSSSIMLSRMNGAFNLLGDVRDNIAPCTGNHEIFYSFDINPPNGISAQATDVESRTLRKFIKTDLVYGETLDGKEKIYFYTDDDKNKIRYIALDLYETFTKYVYHVGIPQSQLNWLSNVALNISDKQNQDEWKFVIYGHQAIATIGGSSGLVRNNNVLHEIINKHNSKGIANASYNDTEYTEFTTSISKDFSNAKGTIIAYYCGHGHEDVAKVTSYGLPVIECTTDTCNKRGMQDRVGTTDEHSIDIITVVPNERRFYITKIGGTWTRPQSVTDGYTRQESYTY